MATSKDIRVLLVKLADRLHNMRTIKFITDNEKQVRKAKETMEIYAPLADRMGMNRIRDELEDLSFQVLNSEAREKKAFLILSFGSLMSIRLVPSFIKIILVKPEPCDAAIISAD